MYVVGNSNGGMFAQAFGCEYPDVVTGIMSVNGMQMLGNSCIPAKPVSFLMYGSFHDKTVPPINIRSQDGYFYEPMQNTIDEWSTKFECGVRGCAENKLRMILSMGGWNKVSKRKIKNNGGIR